MPDAHRPYAIVLAGDAASQPLLPATIERARGLTTPDRILVILSAPQADPARARLAPDVEVIVQPRHLGTGPALVLPIVRVHARDPAARVVVLPADPLVANLPPLAPALHAASHGAVASRIVVIGVPATGPEPDHAWLVPGERIARTAASEVQRFRDRPGAGEASMLWASGGLWNTRIETGPVAAFWRLVSRRLPFHACALERYAAAIGTSRETAALNDAYRMMPPASFSHDVLAHASTLAVIEVAAPAARARPADEICAAV